MSVVRALFTSHVSATQMLLKDDLYEDTHPLVVEHPNWFSVDLLPIAHRGPVTTSVNPTVPEFHPTTDAPLIGKDTRRGPGRPRKIETADQNIEVSQ